MPNSLKIHVYLKHLSHNFIVFMFVLFKREYLIQNGSSIINISSLLLNCPLPFRLLMSNSMKN